MNRDIILNYCISSQYYNRNDTEDPNVCKTVQFKNREKHS